MNAATKQRYISTTIWSDTWFDTLSGTEKLIYFNLLTNIHTNPAGVYPFALKYICADTGFSRDEVNSAMKKFEEAGKAFFYKEYIIIPKWLKHQKITERSGLFLGVVKILKSLPDEIKEFISDRKHYDFDVTKYIGDLPETSLRPPPKKGETLPLKSRGGLGHLPETSPRPPQDLPQKTAHDSDLDSDLDSKAAAADQEAIAFPEEKPQISQPAANIFDIQNLAKAQGFFLSEKQAEDFLCLNPTWITGKYSFLDFTASKIRGDPEYSKKTKGDQERIFAKGWKYESWLQEYPDWLDKKLRADKQKTIDLLRKTSPPNCLRCGKFMGGKDVCVDCNARMFFCDETEKWGYKESSEFEIVADFKQYMRQKAENDKKQKEVEIVENIDF